MPDLTKHLETQLAHDTAQRKRIVAAITCLDAHLDKDILQYLIAANAYLVGATTTMELALASCR